MYLLIIFILSSSPGITPLLPTAPIGHDWSLLTPLTQGRDSHEETSGTQEQLDPSYDVDGITAATAATGNSVPEGGVTHRGCECGTGSPDPGSMLFLSGIFLLMWTRRKRP